MAERIFGSTLPAALRYAELLAQEGVVRGLIGPREVTRLWDRHLLNCAVLEALVPSGADVIDVGSGAGLPGLVLAICRPDLQVTLLEPMQRRTAFLDECVAQIPLANVSVVRARAEESRGKLRAAVVTARAVAPLSALVPIALPLVAPGGMLLAMKGRSAAAELADAEPALRQWPVSSVDVCSVGTDTLEVATVVVRIQLAERGAARRR